MRRLGIAAVAVALSGLLVSTSVQEPAVARTLEPGRTAVATPAASRTASPGPLAGVRIALDPGHQLGNHNFPRQINRPVPAGGFTKSCNTTGTATNGGFPEATFNFRVARQVKKRLKRLGATVRMTRARNSQSLWGPCVDARGKLGAKVGAALMLSIHADGASSSARGFHVIAPASRRPWTSDVAKPSLRLAKKLRRGLDAASIRRSTYIGRGTALSIRSDLGTLNMSDVPVAMVELGNMRNSSDARLMTSAAGRARYADALVRGIRAYLRR